MTLAKLIPLALQASIVLMSFSIALNVSLRDITQPLRRPGLLVRSLLAMNVIMPFFAVTIWLVFDLHLVLKLAFIALALAPVPPILPKKEAKAGGRQSYIIGLLVATALASIVLVPATVGLLNWLFGVQYHVTPATVAKIVGISILAPLAAGVIVRHFAPSVADRIAGPLSIAANVLLLAACVPVLIAEWRHILSLIGNFTLVAIVAYVLVGLAVGHLLGGPDPDTRTVLALSTATRHPAIAMAILHDAPVDQKTALAAVLLVVLVGVIAAWPYVRWRARSQAEGA